MNLPLSSPSKLASGYVISSSGILSLVLLPDLQGIFLSTKSFFANSLVIHLYNLLDILRLDFQTSSSALDSLCIRYPCSCCLNGMVFNFTSEFLIEDCSWSSSCLYSFCSLNMFSKVSSLKIWCVSFEILVKVSLVITELSNSLIKLPAPTQG